MLIAVEGDGRGDASPVYVEVTGTADETHARTLAYLHVYEGHTDPSNAEFPPDEDTLDELTSVVKPAVTIAG